MWCNYVSCAVIVCTDGQPGSALADVVQISGQGMFIVCVFLSHCVSVCANVWNSSEQIPMIFFRNNACLLRTNRSISSWKRSDLDSFVGAQCFFCVLYH